MNQAEGGTAVPGCVVIGIGNILMGDDGAGVHAARLLRGRLPAGVELVEGGVCTLDLLGFLDGRDKAVFIDAIDAGDRPGSVYRFNPDRLRELKNPASSLHDLGVYELILAARLLDQCPGELVIISVQIGRVEAGTELSPAVAGALPGLARLVLAEVEGPAGSR